MKTEFQGKSIFIWNVPAIFGGDPVQIAAWLVSHGFESVMVKCADGAFVFHPSWAAFPNWLTSLMRLGRPNVDKHFVDVLHSYGLQVYGWGFNYGRNPEGEGQVAAEQCNLLGLDGWVVDIEGEFENRKTAIQDAGKFIGKFRLYIMREVPLAYCGWAEFFSPTGSQWHNISLAKFFMGLKEFTCGIPMFYWNSYDSSGKPVPTNPAKVEIELKNILAQWKFTSKKIMPAGRAYTGDGGIASAESILAFGSLARQLCVGATYWVLDHAIKMPLIADALRQTPAWDGSVPVPPVEPPASVTGRYVGRVNSDVTLGLNYRFTPVSGKSLGKLPKNTYFEGDRIELGSDGKPWIHIDLPVTGWIASWFTKYEDTKKDVTL